MTMAEILEAATFKDWMIFLFFNFFWAWLWLGLYVLIFRRLPSFRLIKDWRELMQAIDEMPEEETKEKKIDPDDYWEEEDGEAHSNSRPTVRHPKNANRAYSGSAERFHDGGW